MNFTALRGYESHERNPRCQSRAHDVAEVVEAGGFSAASRQSGSPKSTLSLSVEHEANARRSTIEVAMQHRKPADEARHRPDEARDQHLSRRCRRRWRASRVGGGVPPEGDAARRRLSRAPARRSAPSSSSPSARGRRGRDADRRQRLAERPGRRRRVRAHRRRASATRSAQGCDGVLLDLHGAMVTREPRGRRRRAAAPHPRDRRRRADRRRARHAHQPLRRDAPSDATVIAGYQTYPHVDMYETGAARRPRAARAAAGQGAADDGLGPPADAAARDAPGQRRFAEPRAAGALPRDGGRRARCAPACSSAFRTPTSQYAGLSAVVVTDGDPALARRWCDELLDLAWADAREVRLPARAARRIDGARPGARRRQAARQRPGRAARPLRQLRLGRHDGHDDGARRDPRRRPRGRRRVRDLRSRRRCSR